MFKYHIKQYFFSKKLYLQLQTLTKFPSQQYIAEKSILLTIKCSIIFSGNISLYNYNY